MAGDADTQKLTQAIKEHTHALKDLKRVLDAVNTNFTEYLRAFTKEDGLERDAGH